MTSGIDGDREGGELAETEHGQKPQTTAGGPGPACWERGRRSGQGRAGKANELDLRRQARTEDRG